MTRKSKKTKLLKMVCQRSELMRAPFHGSSWTSKISQTDKKSSFVNKTGEKFRSKVAKLSVGNTWSSIQKVCISEKHIFYICEFFEQMIIIQFLKKGMDRCQTSSAVQTTRTMFMWTSKFEVCYIFEK